MTGEQVATWAGLGLSVLVLAESLWRRASDRTRDQLAALHRRVDELKSTHDRTEGAQLPARVALLEQHQRADQQLLARVDQRLVSVDANLHSIHAILERLP